MHKFRLVATELITQGVEKPYRSPRIVWAGEAFPSLEETNAAIADLPTYPHYISYLEYGDNGRAYYTSSGVDVEPGLKLKKQIGFLPVSRTIETLSIPTEPIEA